MLPHCFYISSVQLLNQIINFHKIWYIVCVPDEYLKITLFISNN